MSIYTQDVSEQDVSEKYFDDEKNNRKKNLIIKYLRKVRAVYAVNIEDLNLSL